MDSCLRPLVLPRFPSQYLSFLGIMYSPVYFVIVSPIRMEVLAGW